MSKEKTPIQELIEWLDMSIDNCEEIGDIAKQALGALESTKRQTEQLLEEEREQIEEAVNYGREYRNLDAEGNKYYIERYGE
jgi:hypothetical protein